MQQLIVIAMGKLGGAELNVSSDIDLVFVFPEDGVTAGPKPLANQEFFDRLGRRVIAALGDVTADGFVFRVEMRLRPYGDSGPLSCSFATLENYLIAQGRTWERYAWLKARPLTGKRGDELMQLITPFVFRKYLDYDAYAGLRDVHRQIREQGKRKDYAQNLKLGPGGIARSSSSFRRSNWCAAAARSHCVSAAHGARRGTGQPRSVARDGRRRARRRIRVPAQRRASVAVSATQTQDLPT